MPKVYANLLGDWVELNGHGKIHETDPALWVKENNVYEYPSIRITYRGKGYQIHSSHIQILSN